VEQSQEFIKDYQKLGKGIETIERPDLIEHLASNPSYLAHRIQEEQKQFEQRVFNRERQL